jgi:hypothetical protein
VLRALAHGGGTRDSARTAAATLLAAPPSLSPSAAAGTARLALWHQPHPSLACDPHATLPGRHDQGHVPRWPSVGRAVDPRDELRRGDGVAAPGGRAPGQHARAGLLQRPAPGLFHSVMAPAQRGEVAQASPAAQVVGHGVVQVTTGGWAPAARVAAGRLAYLDQVAQARRRPVAGCFASVVAGETAQRGDGEGPRPVTGPGSGTRSRLGPRRGAAQAGGWPGASATVGNRAAIRPGERDAPCAAGTPGQRVGQLPRVGGVQRPIPGGVAGFAGPAKPAGQRHGEVDTTADASARGRTGDRRGGTGLTGRGRACGRRR